MLIDIHTSHINAQFDLNIVRIKILLKFSVEFPCTHNAKILYFSTRSARAASKRRCASLTALLHRLNPDVNIEDALETTTILPSGLQASAFDGVSPASVDEFEWSEASLGSPAQLRRVGLDGMASLPTGSTEAGYLGRLQGI
ncbi:hypothetical protein APSETT444_008352 [Aspergillus pseudonomiae]